MSDRSPLSWTCPECSRKVPNRHDTCRCGFVRVEMLPAGSLDTDAAASSGSGKSNALSWMVLGGVAVIAAGVLIAIQVAPVAPSAPAAAASTAPGVTDAAPSNPIDAPAVAPPTADAAVSPLDRPMFPAPMPEPVTPLPSSGAGLGGAPPSLEDMVSRAVPAIVSIEAGPSRGSGFFAASRTVVTNYHVVNGQVGVTVRLSDGSALPGRVQSTSQEHDLALVRVEGAPASQAVLSLGSADTVRPGQEVIAIGLALGVFQNSVTRGIISAVRRADRTVVLQTDAAINPGNSGGPLLNRSGEVIGINTMKVSGAAESLGFAVAADHARNMLSGGGPAPAIASSAPQSQTLAPSFGARTTTDTAREEGTRRFTQFVEAAARQATQLDSYWDRIKGGCGVRAWPGYDHEWFGLWDGRISLTAPDASCSGALKDLEGYAAELRTRMSAAQEDARRASVLPGQLREIRRRHRMDWSGFD